MTDKSDEDQEAFAFELSEPIKTPLEERQELLAHHVRMVARKLSHALFVFGAQGGLGKSRTILRVLEDEGTEPILVNSHITPLAFYALLYRHRTEEIIFMDDTDSIFSSMAHLGLLRSCLWGQPRVVTYNSSQLPDDLPSSFETTARFIFAANVVPKRNDAFKAVLSRCDIFELSASNDEVVEMMRSLSSKGFHGITSTQCSEVIDFISEHSAERQLSLRLLGPSLRKVGYASEAGIDWRPLVLSQLQTLGKKSDTTKRLDNQGKDFRLIEQAIQKFPNAVREQQEFFSQQSGKSRASFFRVLARFREARGE